MGRHQRPRRPDRAQPGRGQPGRGDLLRDQPGRRHPPQPRLRQRPRRPRLVLGRRDHGRLQLQRRGLRQPALRELQRDHRHPADPQRSPPRPRAPAGRLQRPRQRDLRYWRRTPGHRRGRRQRRQPRARGHRLHRQHSNRQPARRPRSRQPDPSSRATDHRMPAWAGRGVPCAGGPRWRGRSRSLAAAGLVLTVVVLPDAPGPGGAVAPIAAEPCQGTQVRPGTTCSSALDAGPAGATDLLRRRPYPLAAPLGRPAATAAGGAWYGPDRSGRPERVAGGTGSWASRGALPAEPTLHGECVNGTLCQYPEMVYVDDRALERVEDRRHVRPGRFWADYPPTSSGSATIRPAA